MMNLNWSKLRKPSKIIKDEKSSSDTFGRFTIEPFERGYATTIGNSLRRIMLSSIVGSAIIGIKVEGVSHEFSTLEGVFEDLTQIIMNLKKVKVKATTPEIISIHLSEKGPIDIKAKDLEKYDERIEILNPDQHLISITDKVKLEMDIDIGTGRGYSSSEDNRRPNLPVDYIPIDSIFTPVTKVSYDIDEEVQIEEKDNFEKLTMDVYTDGSILPEDAIAYSAKIMKEMMNIFINFDEIEEEEEIEEPEQDEEKLKKLLEKSVNELELSKRPANCLKMAHIKTLGDLVRKTHQDMMEFRNFGQKSLQEIKEKLAQYNLHLGMKVDHLIDEDSNESEQEEKKNKKKK